MTSYLRADVGVGPYESEFVAAPPQGLWSRNQGEAPLTYSLNPNF